MSLPMRKLTPETVDKRADVITHEFFQQREYMEGKFAHIDDRFDKIANSIGNVESRLSQIETTLNSFQREMKASVQAIQSNIRNI